MKVGRGSQKMERGDGRVTTSEHKIGEMGESVIQIWGQPFKTKNPKKGIQKCQVGEGAGRNLSTQLKNESAPKRPPQQGVFAGAKGKETGVVKGGGGYKIERKKGNCLLWGQKKNGGKEAEENVL